jgi:predicted HTH domain antitoxin
MMATHMIEVSEELVDLLGSPEDLTSKVRESLVMDLLRAGHISQGKAARLLDVTRWDILDMMVRAKIESGPETIEELHQEIQDVRHLLPRG